MAESKRNERMVRLFAKGMGYSELARKFELSPSRTRQIVLKWLDQFDKEAQGKLRIKCIDALFRFGCFLEARRKIREELDKDANYG